jgi:hypothetical protein
MNDGIDIINDKSFIIAPPTAYKLLNITVGGLKANYFHATKKLATEMTKYKNGI